MAGARLSMRLMADVTALSGLLLGTTVLAPRSRHSPQRDRSGSAVTTTTAAPEAAIGSIRP
jgi:hypothetical protein